MELAADQTLTPRDPAPPIVSNDPTAQLRLDQITSLEGYPMVAAVLEQIALRSRLARDKDGVRMDCIPLHEVVDCILQQFPLRGPRAEVAYAKALDAAKFKHALIERPDRAGLALSVKTPKKVLERVRRWLGPQRRRRIRFRQRHEIGPRRIERVPMTMADIMRLPDSYTGPLTKNKKIRHTEPWKPLEQSPFAWLEKVPHFPMLYRVTDHALRMLKQSDTIAARQRRGEYFFRRAAWKAEHRANKIEVAVARQVHKHYPLGATIKQITPLVKAAGSKVKPANVRQLLVAWVANGLFSRVERGLYRANPDHPKFMTTSARATYKEAAKLTKTLNEARV